jgi:hypothetical protein
VAGQFLRRVEQERASLTRHYLPSSVSCIAAELVPMEQSNSPVSMLCGHDCSLCAPPMASRAAWPGLRPLRRVSYYPRNFCLRAYRWYVLFKHKRQPWSASWSGVRPFRDACVATGMKMGRGTGPWGRCSVAARAFVTWRGQTGMLPSGSGSRQTY